MLIGHIVGYPGVRQMPAWLNEGIATYLAGQDSDDASVHKMAREGKLPSLETLNKAFAGQAPIGNSYGIARSLTAYLVNTYGDTRMAPLFSALSEGSEFNAALLSIVGVDAATLEQGWRQSLVDAY